MESKVYNQNGKETGTVKLPEAVFALPWNQDLVHQVVHSMETDARTPIAHTKTRGEVRGGGKKPWKQKGTGRARHGSIRSPLWVGGGVAHGPRNDKNFARKVNKHMKALALATIICKKMKDGEVLFLDTLKLEEAKTKLAKNVLAALSKIQGFEALTRKKQNAALVAIPSKSTSTERGFRNIGTVSISELRNLNPLDVLRYKYLLISEPDQSVKYIAQKIS